MASEITHNVLNVLMAAVMFESAATVMRVRAARSNIDFDVLNLDEEKEEESKSSLKYVEEWNVDWLDFVLP